MEKEIQTVICMFAEEIKKMDERKAGSHLDLRLEMKNNYDGPKIELRACWYDGKDGQICIAGSLGELMDEVYRRSGFADRQAMKIDELEQSLTAIAGPKEEKIYPAPVYDDSDNIPF